MRDTSPFPILFKVHEALDLDDDLNDDLDDLRRKTPSGTLCRPASIVDENGPFNQYGRRPS